MIIETTIKWKQDGKDVNVLLTTNKAEEIGSLISELNVVLCDRKLRDTPNDTCSVCKHCKLLKGSTQRLDQKWDKSMIKPCTKCGK